MSSRKTILLIDAHALVFRAFFAMPALTNSQGQMINAVYGFTSMLLKALSDYDPDYAVACFDPPGPTFRHEADVRYKAHRPDTPQDLITQLVWCREVVEVLAIPSLELSGFEADDVIGSLAALAQADGLKTIILTGDLDALQLVTDHTHVYASRRGVTDTITYDIDKVQERYGFSPSLVVDYKALQGDSSDNIPGVPGIGAKTATTLIQEYGDLDAILAAVPNMKEGKVKAKLTEFGQQARLSKDLATIRCDVEVKLDYDAAKVGGYDLAKVQELFTKLEIPSLLSRLPKPKPSSNTPENGHATQLELGESESQLAITVINDLSTAENCVIQLNKQAAIRSVMEGSGYRSNLVGLALASLGDKRQSFYLPIDHQDHAANEEVINFIARWLETEATLLVGYDLKRDLLAWQRKGIGIKAKFYDLMLAAYLANSRLRTPSLVGVTNELAGSYYQSEEALLGSGRSKRSLSEVSVTEAVNYYGSLIQALPLVYQKLKEMIKQSGADDLLTNCELPLLRVLAEMELQGIRIDIEYLHQLSTELHQRLMTIEKEIAEIAGYTFNIGSTQQLGKFLYDELGLASGRRTKTGRSTDADSLESLRNEHFVVGLVLEWRQLTKLKNTYVDALPLLRDANNLVHTSFNQAVAATGRLSSSEPNLQNIPVRTEVGVRIREAFIPSIEKYILVSADYSQIELRILAHLSQEDNLLEAFRDGIDVHARTAMAVFNVSLDQVTAEMRRNAKVVNFGVVYGLSDFGLARDTGMSREEAKIFIEHYFANLPKVTSYLESVRNSARQNGYVDTILGRRRYIPDIKAANRQTRLAAERMAINMPMQGAAADIIKLGMLEVHKQLKQQRLEANLLLQVHDELLLEVSVEHLPELAKLLKKAMAGVVGLSVPLEVEIKTGSNWARLISLGPIYSDTSPYA